MGWRYGPPSLQKGPPLRSSIHNLVPGGPIPVLERIGNWFSCLWLNVAGTGTKKKDTGVSRRFFDDWRCFLWLNVAGTGTKKKRHMCVTSIFWWLKVFGLDSHDNDSTWPLTSSIKGDGEVRSRSDLLVHKLGDSAGCDSKLEEN